MCWKTRAKLEQAKDNKALKRSFRLRFLRYIESIERQIRHAELRTKN